MEISIVIPTYNRPELTIRAINSVASQSFKNWNLIVVDDGSTDNTYERVKSYLSTLNNKSIVVKTSQHGVSHARNIGIKLSTAPWISFLDSDDEWLPNKLEKQIQFLKNNPDYLWVYSEEKWMRDNKYLVRKKIHKKIGGQVFDQCVQQCFIGPSSVMISKKVFNDVGLFNESFPACEDYELWLRISKKFPVGFIDEELLIKYGGHDDQLSRTTPAMDYWRVKALVPHLSSDLNESSLLRVKNYILKKSDILATGFKKYNHTDKYNEIISIQTQLSSS